MAQAPRQLSDSEYYQKVDRDLTPEHSKTLNDAIKKLATKKLIDEKTAKSLHTDDAKTPKFYMLPRVHKAGRSSAINSPTSDLARFVDQHLQPLRRETSFVHQGYEGIPPKDRKH